MNPTPAAISWIEARSPDWTQSDASIAATLNALTEANPASVAPRVPATCYPSDILPLLATGSLAKIDASNFASKLYDDMAASNSAGVARWAQFYAGINSITGPEAEVIVARTQATIPDPSWTAEVPTVLIQLGRLLDAADITAARAAKGD